jgi:predicted AAA+ superfamily ATPase
MNKVFIRRELETEIKRLSQHFPVVVITVPRQSGKTTLCRNLFADYHYVDITRASDRQIIESNPEEYLKQYSDGLIIDEAQYYPELFPYIRIVADELPESKFIISDSGNHLFK